MSFHVGQKVVCVGDTWPWELWLKKLFFPPLGQQPVVGRVYTVAAYHPDTHCKYGPSIELHGVWSPENKHWLPGFLAYDFKPVIERKTDISSLVALLNPANHRERVGA